MVHFSTERLDKGEDKRQNKKRREKRKEKETQDLESLAKRKSNHSCCMDSQDAPVQQRVCSSI
jgi:hypothetical protein